MFLIHRKKSFSFLDRKPNFYIELLFEINFKSEINILHNFKDHYLTPFSIKTWVNIMDLSVNFRSLI